MTSRGEVLLKSLVGSPRQQLRASIASLKNHTTSDARRLTAKLNRSDVEAVTDRARVLIETEGTFLDYSEVNAKATQQDLELLLDIQVTRQDIISWASDHRSLIESQYSTERLDWLWDFSWTHQLWGPKHFKRQHYLVYGAVLGNKPENLHRVPFQAVLNRVRKDAIKRREKELYRACRDGDRETLTRLGFSEEQMDKAIAIVKRASV